VDFSADAVEIRVRKLNPDADYRIQVWNPGCFSSDLTYLGPVHTTNKGTLSGSFPLFGRLSTGSWIQLDPVSNNGVWPITPPISF